MIKWFKRLFRKRDYDYAGTQMLLAFPEGFSLRTDKPVIAAFIHEGETRYLYYDHENLPIVMAVEVVGFYDDRAPERNWE